MRILAVDIGTGTQDILLFDSSKVVENCIKMVMPSPTSLVADRISEATKTGKHLLLKGVTMGGGPCKRALARHIQKGLIAYATIEAALTFDDDLEMVKSMGVTIVASDELPQLPNLKEIELKDLDLKAIRQALASFGVDHYFDALAVAVLDHGFAPPGVPNGLFRFDHFRRMISQRNELASFAYLKQELPEYLTRMKAVIESVDVDVPVLLLDTGVAAALGALRDKDVVKHEDLLAVNVGNSHTIAFHLHGESIEGLFEHHTSLLSTGDLDILITKLLEGTLTNEEVYENGGHGAMLIDNHQCQPFITAIGPRWDLIANSSLGPHRALPFGDTMLAGCYGLISACALRMQDWRDEIEQALALTSNNSG
jgi:uncharacterized protein (DUF1786 family)